MVGFHTLQLQDLNEQLKPVNTGRVSQWQTFQRGIDTRSGNILMSDNTGKRRSIIGKKSDGEFIIAISAAGIDVINALG